MELGRPCRQERPILSRRPETGHRLGQIAGGQNRPNTPRLEGFGDVDGMDSRVGAVQMNQLGMKHARQFQIRHVLLGSQHAREASDPANRLAYDSLAHLEESAAAWTASTILT